jgi:hypothetical protein
MVRKLRLLCSLAIGVVQPWISVNCVNIFSPEQSCVMSVFFTARGTAWFACKRCLQFLCQVHTTFFFHISYLSFGAGIASGVALCADHSRWLLS